MPASDRDLLQRFTRQNDEGAFETLLTRHGPMVLGLCRRLLHDRHAAEDAYQATFFVLARNAATIRRPEALGSWLYGVTFRVARRLRTSAPRERLVERLPDVPTAAADPVSQVVWRELGPLIDEELHRLPDKYRGPLILCDLQGQSNADAARALGCPASSLSSRLARGREILRGRLASRGVALSTGLLFDAIGEQALASASPALVQATVHAVALLNAGQSAAAEEGATPSALALAEGTMRSMLLAKVKVAAAILLAIGLFGTAAALAWHRPGADPVPIIAEGGGKQDKPRDEPVPGDGADPAPAGQPDPVADLRDPLRLPVRDPQNKEELAFRKALVQRQSLDLG